MTSINKLYKRNDFNLAVGSEQECEARPFRVVTLTVMEERGWTRYEMSQDDAQALGRLLVAATEQRSP